MLQTKDTRAVQFGALLAECLNRGVGNPDGCAWTKKAFSRGILSSPDMISRYINDPKRPLPQAGTMAEIRRRFLGDGSLVSRSDRELVEQLTEAWNSQRSTSATSTSAHHKTKAPHEDAGPDRSSMPARGTKFSTLRDQLSVLPFLKWSMQTELSTANQARLRPNLALYLFALGSLLYFELKRLQANQDVASWPGRQALADPDDAHPERNTNLIVGTQQDDLIAGTERHDVAYGVAGDNTYVLGRGDDTALGGAGADRYVYRIGDGADVIFDAAAQTSDDTVDVLIVHGATLSDARFRRAASDGAISHDDLIIEFKEHDGSVRIVGGLSNTSTSVIERFIFSDSVFTPQAEQHWDGVSMLPDLLPGEAHAVIQDGQTVIESAAGDVLLALSFGSDGSARLSFVPDDKAMTYDPSVLFLIEEEAVTQISGTGLAPANTALPLDRATYQMLQFEISTVEMAVGSPASDSIYGYSATDIVLGRGGADHIIGMGGGDLLFGGAGNDMIFGDHAPGALANGMLPVHQSAEVLIGGRGDDQILTGHHNNTIVGAQGHDQIAAKGGDDILFGGHGDDTLGSGSGDDFVYGGDGDDIVYGNPGADHFFGGNGHDTLIFDFMPSAMGLTVELQTGVLSGHGSENDQIGGFEVFIAGQGDDVVRASQMGVTLDGQGGDDLLAGHDGDDHLIDGTGSDRVQGGLGEDVFVFVKDGALDRIIDFKIGEDRIDLSAWGISNAALVAVNVHPNQTITLSYADEVLLIGMADEVGPGPTLLGEILVF